MSWYDNELHVKSNLTNGQLMLWTGMKMNPDDPIYNIIFTFEIQGAVDKDLFIKSFDFLVKKSEVLRTVFIEKDGIPFQKVLSDVKYNFEYEDLTGRTDEESVREQRIQKHRSNVYDLSTLLFDVSLLKISDSNYLFALNQHHLIADAWGQFVLFNKLGVIYSTLLEKQPIDHIQIPPFSDYLVFEKKHRLFDNTKQATYWKEKADKVEPVKLYGIETSLSTEADRLYFELGLERSEQLRALAMSKDYRSFNQDLAIYQIFCSVIFLYLHKISGQNGLSFGTPTHNRLTPKFKDSPGLFMEFFPLQVSLSEEENLSSLHRKVVEETLIYFQNVKPGLSTPEVNRKFNVVFNYVNATVADFAGHTVQSTYQFSGHNDPRHSLLIQANDYDNSGNIKIQVDLKKELLSTLISDFIPDQFLKCLDAFLDLENIKIAEVDIVGDREKDYLIHVLDNNTEHENNSDFVNILTLIDKQASQDKGSVICGGEELGLKEINKRANQLARYLKNSGIEVNDRVAIWMKRTPDLLVSILGVLKSGAAYVPIDSFQSNSRVAEMIEDADVKMLLTPNEFSQKTDLAFEVPVLKIDTEWNKIIQFEDAIIETDIDSNQVAYVMYTSGSTGKPKGVMISHGNLSFYLNWAKNHYNISEDSVIPLFSAIGFDLTVTSIFLPLISGSKMICYKESDLAPDLSVVTVVEDNKSSFIKLTPSHLELLSEVDLSSSRINTMVLGGENLKFDLARNIVGRIGSGLNLYNEYGPTEATVGCIVHEMTSEDKLKVNVPIGRPINGTYATLLDSYYHQVPQGVEGELFISGPNLAQGYWNDEELSNNKFIRIADLGERRFYRTGDLARMNELGCLEFLGRKDEQVKVGGIRLELGEIESAINKHPEVNNCVVDLKSRIVELKNEHILNCSKCGLPSNYPNITFDDEDICSLCQSYSTYGHRVAKYFKSPEYLKSLILNHSKTEEREYDCIALLSGGKDSTYALGKLVDMGLSVLAFTLDNGYISDQAKDNIKRVVEGLGVDHVFGSTPHMNEIFVDSLEKHYNVCDGCFKTIYTLSANVALEKKIPYIVTGLSRGQFFETRLTEELFTDDNLDISKIDSVILDARKAYHKVDDAVNKLLDVSSFEDSKVFERVKFLDFYRYTDVSLDEMLEYLDQKLPWKRPTDTGRSTNCLINQAGIFVHKKERGYSNYAFPYSWDVRLGHKKRDASLDEINEEIDEQQVHQMLQEIGYEGAVKSVEDNHLIAYYVSDTKINENVLRAHLEGIIVANMIPKQFIPINNFPLNNNGKVDKKSLPLPDLIKSSESMDYVAPRTDIEEILVDIWSEVLNLDKVGVHDRFLDLGGSSLAAIRIISRANEAFELELPVNLAFNKPTIASFAIFVRDTILRLLEEEDD